MCKLKTIDLRTNALIGILCMEMQGRAKVELPLSYTTSNISKLHHYKATLDVT